MPAHAPAETLRTDGYDAFAAGDHARAAELLGLAARETADPDLLNDLAVVHVALDDAERARALLLTCLTLDAEHTDALANLQALDASRDQDMRSWRGSATLGGSNARVPERAYPGMALPETMSEHAMRYSLALGLLAQRHVLDVGCGTGYGSEMLTWTAASVRGFDLWRPAEHEHPRWPGGAELTYGFDVCKDPLPSADAAVMFEITEHLHDAPAALRNAFSAVDTLIVSFPNPRFHGSHLNPHHVNDWPLERFEAELKAAALTRYGQLKVAHMYQPLGAPTIAYGRDPEAPFWIILAKGEGSPGRTLNLPR